MFERVVGHDAAKRTLSRALSSGHSAHAYFFVGPPQVGKRTLALAFAQSLLCPEPSPPCANCSTCMRVDAALHPDLLTLGQQERRGPRPDLKLEQVHDLQRMIGLAPFEGRCRVAIIDGAERLLNEAANALLKTLEEPPPASYLLLLSEAEELVLPTIVSRCQRIIFGLSVSAIRLQICHRLGKHTVRLPRVVADAHKTDGRLKSAVLVVDLRYGQAVSLAHSFDNRADDSAFIFQRSVLWQAQLYQAEPHMHHARSSD